MTEKSTPKDQYYEIRLKGHLEARWMNWFDGMSITLEKEGNTLLVPELSRLGRSVGQVVLIVDELIRKKVTVVCLKENIKLNGEKDLQATIMITMFSLFAEIERKLICERTREGLARARAEGKLLGRPKGTGKSRLDEFREEIISLLRTGSKKNYLAKKYKVSEPCLYNWLKKHAIKVQPLL